VSTPNQVLKNNFAFVIHPVDPRQDVARKFKLLGRYLPVSAINYLSLYFPPLYLSHVAGINSRLGQEIDGWLLACPLTPARMLSLPVELAYKKIVEVGHLAERLGARLLGLGALTSVIGDAGLTVSERLNIPVTTGDSYTVAVAAEAVKMAAARMGVNLRESHLAVVGATGAIGRACAELLLDDVGSLLLIARRRAALEELQAQLAARGRTSVRVASQVEQIREADVIISASSSLDTLLRPEYLKRGAVICDVARPRDVARQVAKTRKDVLVIDGGVVEVPGPVDFGFDFGLRPKMAYACMAETMILALEGRYESYSIGRRLSVAKIKEMAGLAQKHGFKVASLLSFDRTVSERHIAAIRDRAEAHTSVV